MSDDDELMAEIARLGDEAANIGPRMRDSLAMAATLAPRFDHRTMDEIREQIRVHWRARGLFLAD